MITLERLQALLEEARNVHENNKLIYGQYDRLCIYSAAEIEVYEQLIKEATQC